MATYSRRDFLEQSMLAAAAAATTSSLSTAAFADNTIVGSNDRLQVAVLGVRGRGKAHLDSFSRNPHTEIAVISDPDEEIGRKRAKEVASATGKEPRFIQDTRTACEDPAIDIVSIASPNHWHALSAIWALQAGKDVFVEKPCSYNVSEGRRIVQAARKYDRICQHGTQNRASANVREAMYYLHRGELGEIKVSRGLCYKRRPSIGKVDGPQEVPSHIDYNVWTGPAPLKPLERKNLHYDWHWDFDYGNGDMGNQGAHQMDIARWALGVGHFPDEVVSLGGRFGYEDNGNTPNTLVTFMKYGDRQLIFETRGLETEKYRGAAVGNIIHCEGGYVVLGAGYAAFDLDGKLIRRFDGGGDIFANFIKAVHSRKVNELNADIEEGHLSSALCHLGNITYQLGGEESFEDCEAILEGNEAALESMDRTKHHLKQAGVDHEAEKIIVGRRLRIDSASESFVDDVQANALLAREPREPFVVPAEDMV